MIKIDHVLQRKELEHLYAGLMRHKGWYLSRTSRTSEPTDLMEGTFLGLDISDGSEVHEPYWAGYFEAVYFKIAEMYKDRQRKHSVLSPFLQELPSKITRIHLVAKQEGANTKDHTDSNDPRSISLVGMLTPTWESTWGGEFTCEGRTIEYTPGSFVVLNSNQRHNGFGPKIKTPYWRIVVNYMVTE